MVIFDNWDLGYYRGFCLAVGNISILFLYFFVLTGLPMLGLFGAIGAIALAFLYMLLLADKKDLKDGIRTD